MQNEGWKSYEHINRCREIIWQNPAPIYDKISHQRGNISQHTKSHRSQKHSQHYTQWAKTKSIFLKIRNNTGLLPVLFNIVLEVLATEIKQEKEMKFIHIGKEEVKLSLFSDVMILCIDNPKDYTKYLLEMINGFSKVAKYKINIQKSVVFYTPIWTIRNEN